ncbi:MAG: lytic transglycosylase F [Sterolibacteriaceae bacterium]|nr:lytic transglycosylase F [Candidatus Methylophosphatis haderslevensis]
MNRYRWMIRFLAGATIAAAISCCGSSLAASAAPAVAKVALPTVLKPFKGDFEAMKQRRLIRVAVPYSRTLYFNDRGVQRGLTADAVQEFERWLNRKLKTGALPITVSIIPTTRDRLLPMLTEGRADIAAGNLTITPERDSLVDFSQPFASGIAEVVVAGPASPAIGSLDELSGRQVHVRPASSYYQSLLRLNEHFLKAGKPAVSLKRMPDALEDEDLMDMLNAGIIEYIVVDNWKASLWAGILPGIRVLDTLKVAEDGRIGWAFRQASPQLAAIVNEFARSYTSAGSAAQRLAVYQKRWKQLKNPAADTDWQRFEQSVQLFQKYGDRYGFDYLMVTAQGFQESRLDQNAKSRAGAVGIMQLMPTTGKALGVGDIHQAEPNVHGGIKYMRNLLDNYFKDAHFDDTNRTLFAFAAYNAGPGRIAGLRREAAKQGLDPDIWFNNVELVAARRIGQESVSYVRNIYKYYMAYKLQLETLQARRHALDGASPK